MTDNELHSFFENLVRELHARGVICAITSGLACVHYGVAETTKDCDLLCHPDSFQTLLDLLAQTRISGQSCLYRGNISPPLDARWHQGGWTSHFQWGQPPEVTTLDVFGHALRESSPWQDDLAGLYAGQNVVAEMKRTDRDKDWPYINSLGVELLRSRDPRGWLHLFDAGSISEMLEEFSLIPNDMLALRPALQLAATRDPLLPHALLAERHFWQELDRRRIRICRAALRPYVLAMGRASNPQSAGLSKQHAARLACAEKHLDQNPVRKYGVERMIQEARESTAEFINPSLMRWLPDVRPHFRFLTL
ncbi:MAG: hypothetical protein IH623_22395 [Verrucomicrobia bacterium]|nr:hypothetical protein [Verrucomicrobiota bacterium]